MPTDIKTRVAASALGSHLSAAQITRNNYGYNYSSSMSRTAPSDSNGRLPTPNLQFSGTCTIPHGGYVAAVLSLQGDGQSEDNLEDISLDTVEPANATQEEMLSVSLAVGNEDFEASGSESTGTHFSAEAAETSREQDAGTNSGIHYETVYNENCHCSDERGERQLPNDQAYLMDNAGTQTGETNYACADNHNRFAHKMNIGQAMFDFTDKKARECRDSREVLTCVSTLKVLTHSRDEPHVCNECGQRFAQKCYLTMHVLSHHTQEEPHVCSDCGKMFWQKSTLSTRCMLTHAHEGPRVCDDCRKRLTREGTLTKHVLTNTHEKPHICNECGQTFVRKSALTFHTLTHTHEKPHVCSECGKRFVLKRYLTTHMHTHAPDKPHICDECGQRFGRKSHLATHTLTHTHEKPHVCSDCGRRFAQKGSLQKHVLTHTLEKPHKCSECGKRFSQKSNLTTHVLIHTREKPHMCDECGKTFAQKSNLTRHMLTHMREKPKSVVNVGKDFCAEEPNDDAR